MWRKKLVKKDLHCPTCGRSMQQRSNKIFNTFRPMAIQNHRPSIPSIGTSIKKNMDENQWRETRRMVREIQVLSFVTAFSLIFSCTVGMKFLRRYFDLFIVFEEIIFSTFLYSISAFLESLQNFYWFSLRNFSFVAKRSYVRYHYIFKNNNYKSRKIIKVEK